MMGDEQGRGTQDLIPANPVQEKYVKTSLEHKNIFLNFEDEQLQGHMQKTSINKRWNSKVSFNYSFVESRIDSFANKNLMLIKN